MSDLAPVIRQIDSICTVIDGLNDIIFSGENTIENGSDQPCFMRRYTIHTLSNIFRAMGCQMPLNDSMTEWIFNFLRSCPEEHIATILGKEQKHFFNDPRVYSHGVLVLSRLEFHRLVSAALYVHQFRKVRYCVDFRLTLDFIEERRFFIVLLSGAPGTGKSKLASLLASRMYISHIISTDSIRHAMRTFYPKKDYPVLHCSTYECGDIVDPDHKLPDEERRIKGYQAQSELVGQHLIKVIQSFVNSRTSLIVEGVHLSVDIMLKIVKQFPNVVPFLIYIKKEDFHRQRFAVRAKYMTTDPSQNRYISNFEAIRTVQHALSQGASEYQIPKIDNRNIDRSLETLHQTLFSYLKKLEGRPSMYDPESGRLSFLDTVWKRRKQKMTSKTKTLKLIKSLKAARDNPPPVNSIQELLDCLPAAGQVIHDDFGGDDLRILSNGTMLLMHDEQDPPIIKPDDLPEKDSIVVEEEDELESV